MGPEALEEILKGLPQPVHPNLLVGIDTRDDAGVFKLTDDLALIQTVDFFTPMVDDPYVFGQIAATNALNDVYAMGGKPLMAMNIVCYPECEDLNTLHHILEGGLSKVKEAGALLVGGHTVDDLEPKYGLAVAGLVHPQRVLKNNGARVGDRIYLTKPLGTGIISTAIKAEMASAEAYDEAVYWMTRLNSELSYMAQDFAINGLTDVTGFGLIGHLSEMAQASNVAIEINTGQIPCMKAALEYASYGLIPAGAYTNREYLQKYTEIDKALEGPMADLLFAPETAGGLLIAVNEDNEARLIEALKNRGSKAALVGQVLHPGFKPVKVKP